MNYKRWIQWVRTSWMRLLGWVKWVGEHWTQSLRLVALSFILLLVATAVVQVSSAGIKAPLLTMMGSASIIVVLFSIDRSAITIQNVGTILGTAIVVLGGGYWLTDARQHGSANDLSLSSFLTNGLILLLFIYVTAVLIPIVYNLVMRIRSR